MRRILWLFGWAGVLVWSLFSALVYGAIDGIGGLAARHADLLSNDPDTVVWLARTFGALRNVSTSATLVVWGFVSLLILAVPWLFDRVATPPLAPSSPFVPSADGRVVNREQGVIDLSPGEYTVRTRGPGGSVPPTGPRG